MHQGCGLDHRPLLVALTTRPQEIFEHLHCHKNGSLIHRGFSASPLIGEKGEIDYIIHVSRNITPYKRIEAERIQLKKAGETSGEAMFLTDPQGVFTSVNPEFTQLHGFRAEEIAGKDIPRVLKSGVMKPQDYQDFWKTILNKQIVRGGILRPC